MSMGTFGSNTGTNTNLPFGGRVIDRSQTGSQLASTAQTGLMDAQTNFMTGGMGSLTPQNAYNNYANTLFGTPSTQYQPAFNTTPQPQTPQPGPAQFSGQTTGTAAGGWWGTGADPSEAGFFWDPQTNQWARTVQYTNSGQPLNMR